MSIKFKLLMHILKSSQKFLPHEITIGQSTWVETTAWNYSLLENREVDAWHEDELEEESFFENQETTALIGSMLVHLIVILTLALVPLRAPVDDDAVVIVSPPEYSQEIEELTIRADARAGHSSTKIRSHTAWTRVKSCDGHLIVVMGRACEFSRAYFQNSRGSDFPLLDKCPFISEN